MTITQKLRSIFPGVSIVIDALRRGFRAACEWDKQMNGIKTLQSELYIDKRMVRIAKYSPLTFYDAYRIVTVLNDKSEAFKQDPDSVILFIIERACKGYTADVIIAFLKQKDASAVMKCISYVK